MRRRADDEEPRLPIKLEPCSNGEYVPPPATELVREAVRRAREACDDNARRTGLTRRQFLRSACGAATTLAVLAACSDDERKATGKPPAGTFDVPPEATTEPDAAQEVLGGDELVMDVQTHFLEYDLTQPLPDRWLGSGFPQVGCGEDDPRACFSTDQWLDLVLARSDTTVAVVSAVPVVGPDGPLSTEKMDAARRAADRVCGEGRVLIQGHVAPTAGQLDGALAAMDDTLERSDVAAWKVYTHAAGPGWYLDDHDPTAPQVGRAFVEHALALGVPIISVHKGFSGGSRYAAPVDIGPAAVAHPDARFVVYHSGFEAGGTEGPFDDATRDQGVNRLLASVADAGLGSGSNVYAELGSTWRSLMGSPDQAAHVLGKLLLHLGPDNVIWGTDSIWYGSPQDQIQAFRAFTISPELQERHGYPPLTEETKAKVLGGNAARLYGVDPTTVRCDLTSAEREELRLSAPSPDRTWGPATATAVATHQATHGWL